MYLTGPKRFFSILTLFVVVSVSTYAQGTIIPLMQEGWVGGLSGFIGWDNYTAKANNEVWNVDSDTKGFGFVISSRNGRFVEDNVAFGFDFQWEEQQVITTRNDLDGYEITDKDRLGFIGLWVRYYIPFIGTGWAIYPELSVGYGNYRNSEEPGVTPSYSSMFYYKTSGKADGLVYNVGFGGTIFVSNNVAFEATVRYQGGKLTGEYEVNDEKSDNLEVQLSNIDVLFGIMVYLR